MRRDERAGRLIVALDSPTMPRALAIARRLRGCVRLVKIGSVLFTACGPSIVQRVRAMGFQVMLDLKFLDIPTTVALSCQAAVRQRIAMLTVHAAGEPEMLRAAVVGARAEARRLRIARPLVLGVTVLTSVKGSRRAGTRPRVVALAQRAVQSGCDGVVASAQEAPVLRRRFGRRLRIVCPGIRRASARADDQQRVATPAAALRAGADFLVVGRPITAARDPRAAAQRILRAMSFDVS